MWAKLLGQGYKGNICAILAGGLITLSLAPFNVWLAGLLSCGLLVLLFESLSPKQAIIRGWFYGFGMFGSGSSWVYVSIHEFGYAPVPLAVFITLLFTGGFAITWMLYGYLYSRFIKHLPAGKTLGFAALFVLGEWSRDWFLTGFPWLYLGYGHLNSPLAGWAPIGGVFSLSFITALSGAALAGIYLHRQWRHYSIMISAILWLSGLLLQHISWVQPTDRAPISVAMVQANISQAVKWNHDQYWPTLDTYRLMSQPLWSNSDIVIWPEAAIPGSYQKAKGFLDIIATQANKHSSSLITGIPSTLMHNGQPKVHNSIIVLGNGEGFYHKQRLVPFGEYVPLESILRDLIALFDLPMSAISPGQANQALLKAAGISLAPLICYEVVFSNLVSQSVPDADLLLTVSNDAWFGNSLGPLQHLEIAQMRALETGRYLVRSTGNGISAIIDEKGQIVVQGPQFERAVIRGQALAMSGATPYALTGTWPIISLCLMIYAALLLLARRSHY